LGRLARLEADNITTECVVPKTAGTKSAAIMKVFNFQFQGDIYQEEEDNTTKKRVVTFELFSFSFPQKTVPQYDCRTAMLADDPKNAVKLNFER
jgi:hypothetical protein